VKNLKKLSLFVIGIMLMAFTVCAASPAVAEQSWTVEPADMSNEILNDTEQAELVELVVFAFTIGIIITILGFAMGIMGRKG
jgi:nitrate reductase gamma subunit